MLGTSECEWAFKYSVFLILRWSPSWEIGNE